MSRAEEIVKQLEEMSEDGRCSSHFNFGLIRRVEDRVTTQEGKQQRMFADLLKAQQQLGELLAIASRVERLAEHLTTLATDVGDLTRRVERIADYLNRQKGGEKQ